MTKGALALIASPPQPFWLHSITTSSRSAWAEGISRSGERGKSVGMQRRWRLNCAEVHEEPDTKERESVGFNAPRAVTLGFMDRTAFCEHISKESFLMSQLTL